MAFDARQFARLSSPSNSDVTQIFGYATNDTLATVVASDYFGEVVSDVTGWNVQPMDKICVRYDEDGTPGYAELVVTSTTAGAVTVGQTAVDGAVWITTTLTDVSTASSTYIAAPFAGTIRRFKTILQGAITVGNAAVKLQIATVDVTGAAVTVAQAGSAAGDVDQATATAANAVTAGQAVEIESDGGSTDTAALVCMVEFIPAVVIENTTWVCYTIPDVSTASSHFVAAPFAGTIRKWKTVLATTVASFGSTDCNLSLEIGGTPVTGSAIVISGTGEAVGDVDQATCTAANTVTAGQAVEIITGGESSGTIPVFVMIEFVPA